jgi:hypothetical protein
VFPPPGWRYTTAVVACAAHGANTQEVDGASAMHEGLKAAKNTGSVIRRSSSTTNSLSSWGRYMREVGMWFWTVGVHALRCATPAEAGLKGTSKIGESRLGCWLVALLPQCLFCCCWWGSSVPAQWFVLLSLLAVCVCVWGGASVQCKSRMHPCPRASFEPYWSSASSTEQQRQ